jgi:hypothetical protein
VHVARFRDVPEPEKEELMEEAAAAKEDVDLLEPADVAAGAGGGQ